MKTGKILAALWTVCFCLTAVSSQAQNEPWHGRKAGLFPVYDITLGVTTMDELQEMGYNFEDWGGGSYASDVYDLDFWDHTDDGIPEVIYIIEEEEIPEQWVDELGFSWDLSYEQWLAIFEGMGYTIRVTDDPLSEVRPSRRNFSAEVYARSEDGWLDVRLRFDRTRHNESGCLNRKSPGTLYSIHMKIVSYDENGNEIFEEEN